MKRRHFLAFIATIALILLFSTGVKLVKPPVAIARETTILVSAAASLKDALQEIKTGFERANPNIQVNYNFGASGALQQQIERGAPADVFISAATRQMDDLERNNRILKNTRRNLLKNRLVLIVPTDSTLKINSFRDLTNPIIQKIAVGEFRSVPAGQYSEQVFKNIGILEEIRPKIVFANSVRGVLAAVETGNADAGVVYATDARISERVKAIATAPENLHSPIVYPMALVAASQNQPAARAYMSYLTQPPARAIFEKFGFGIAR